MRTAGKEVVRCCGDGDDAVLWGRASTPVLTARPLDTCCWYDIGGAVNPVPRVKGQREIIYVFF